jgi:uncharacterized protein YhfF
MAGPMRGNLNALVLTGEKVATAGPWVIGYEREGEALDVVGERQVLLDSQESPLAQVEITRVDVHRFVDVTWEFAQAEGEGFASIEDWRASHRQVWEQDGAPVHDDTPVVCTWFRVVP